MVVEWWRDPVELARDPRLLRGMKVVAHHYIFTDMSSDRKLARHRKCMGSKAVEVERVASDGLLRECSHPEVSKAVWSSMASRSFMF